MKLIVATLVLSACSSKPAPATPTAASPTPVAAQPAGPDCEAAISNSLALSKDMMVKNGADDAALAKMHDAGVQHCKDDKWSDAAVKCMVAAKTMNDAQGCYGQLTPEQQDAMNKSVGG